MGNFTKEATDSNFETDVLGSDKAVLVDCAVGRSDCRRIRRKGWRL